MKRFLGVLFILVLITAVSAVPTLAASEDTVSVNAPTEVPEGGSFTASVEISELIMYGYGLSSYYFEVSYDPTVLHLKDVTDGQVWGSAPSLFLWEWLPQGVENSGKIRVGAVVIGSSPVYSDYLCEMDFDVIGSAGEVSPIALSEGILINAWEIEIPNLTWVSTVVQVMESAQEPPVADIGGPYSVDEGSALILDGSGSYDPDEAAGDSIISYEWDLDNDGMFDDATGTTPTISWATTASLGMAYPTDPATGLPNNTIRLRVTDTFGVTSTSATTLTIYDNQPEAPTVTTDAASGVSCMVATLNGTVNANGFSTTVTFEYGLTTAYATIVTADQSPVTGDTGTAVSKTLSGLTTNTTYHYRVVATNAGGTTYGADMTFTTKSGEPARGKAYGKDDAPGQNKEPGEPADGKGDAPGQNKEPGEPADGKAYGNDHAPGQNKEPGEPADGKGYAPGQNK